MQKNTRRDQPADLSAIRQAIIDREVPVLMDLSDVAAALDLAPKTVAAKFENHVMVGERYLIRAAEVREYLLVRRPKAKPEPERVCRSCRAPLPKGAKRFCSPRCAQMTLTARAALVETQPLFSGIKTPAFLRPEYVPNAQGWPPDAGEGRRG